MQQSKSSTRPRAVTKSFEKPKLEAPPARSSETIDRMAQLETQMARANEFLGVLAERMSELESQSAELRDELLILRASRVRSPSSPYNTMTPPEETVVLPKTSRTGKSF